MRRAIGILGVVSLMAAVGFASHRAWAFPQLAMKTKADCAACHTNPAGGMALTDAGKAYQADASKVPAATAGGAEYVGSNKCKICHMRQYKSWQGTDHAKAMTTLASGDPKLIAEMAKKLNVEIKGSAAKTDACVECHVTGFHLKGGYPAADSTKNAALAMVSCEACHGPGSKHIVSKDNRKGTIVAAVSEKMCRQCHTAETSVDFKFAEYQKKIMHPKATPAPTK